MNIILKNVLFWERVGFYSKKIILKYELFWNFFFLQDNFGTSLYNKHPRVYAIFKTLDKPKTIVGDYGFNFLKKFKIVVTNYGFGDVAIKN